MVCSGWKGCQALGDAIVNLRNLEDHTSVKFSVVSFMFRSLINLDLSFVHSYRYEPIFILLHVDYA